MKYGHGFTCYYMTCRALSIAVSLAETLLADDKRCTLCCFDRNQEIVEHSIQKWGMRQNVYQYAS